MERFGYYTGTKIISLTPGRQMLTVQQSLGWEHYEVHEPEPHILLFKFEFHNSMIGIPADQKTGDLSITFHQANRDTAELVEK